MPKKQTKGMLMALLIVIILMNIAGVVSCISGTSYMKKQCAETTTGHIVNVQRRGSRLSRGTAIDYTYDVDGETYGVTETMGGFTFKFKPDTDDTVHYSAENPGMSYIGSQPPQMTTIRGKIIGVVVFGAMLFFIIKPLKLKRKATDVEAEAISK